MLSLVEAFIGFFSRIKGKDATPMATPMDPNGATPMANGDPDGYSKPLFSKRS